MRQERWTAFALWALALLALLLTERAVGYVRDESVYFAAGQSYAAWLRLLVHAPALALQDASIVRFFEENHEHPVLMKLLFGLSHAVLHEELGLMRPATAFRLPALALNALIPALVYRMGSSLWGRTAGLFAALSFFLVPRQLFNAELACFDMPVAAMWLLVVYAFWRALDEARWGWACGLAFGLALGTKHNALFLPVALAPFALARAWTATSGAGLREARRTLGLFVAVSLAVPLLFALMALSLGPEGLLRRIAPLSPATFLAGSLVVGLALCVRRLSVLAPPAARALGTLVAMLALGPLLFYLHWPYLWHHPVDRTAWYLAFHAEHLHYAWFYLGQLLVAPPFPLAYVFVVTALTVPLSLLAPMVTGLLGLAVRALRRRASLAELLVGAHALASILLISHPQVPHFGGVKHWLPSMPFLAMLAGASVARGCAALSQRLPARVPRAAVAAPVFALLFAPALLGLARVHPYCTSFYGELAGGLPGAASLGMQRQFWSNNVTGVLPWINAHAPQGARIYLHEVNGYSFRDYQRNGQLRSDLRPAGGPEDADLAAVQYHQEFREHEVAVWQAFGTQVPVTGLYVDETPQVIVYRRP
nr:MULTISPECIES: glycosyltransferase family 39 protein [Myxococcaceae]